MTCEVCVGVAVDTMTVLSWTIFSCMFDRLVKKVPLYIIL